jgi:purine-binding chemotaxis protein CheW
MSERSGANLKEYVTAMVGDQLFGLSILRVQDVFVPERITRVPLAGADVAGLINLRGRIVTLIDMRRRLDLDARAPGSECMAIGVEVNGESYGLLVDSVGEVLKLDEATREPKPVNLDDRLAKIATGIFRLEERLLVIVDVDRILDIGELAIAA